LSFWFSSQGDKNYLIRPREVTELAFIA